jgi:purine-binding chemotaxis protein CheW
MTATQTVPTDDPRRLEEPDQADYITMTVAGQLFGLPVLSVRDVLGPQRITRVPLAPAEVAGSLNLRGRVVTAIDLRRRLGMPTRDDDTKSMSVVVDRDGELYSLMIDSVGEVLTLLASRIETNPPTMDGNWREVSNGICRLDDRLLVLLDIRRILEFRQTRGT